jgi:hypothetical protein
MLAESIDEEFENFYYQKLGMQNWMRQLPSKMLEAYDPFKVRLILIPNMFRQQ